MEYFDQLIVSTIALKARRRDCLALACCSQQLAQLFENICILHLTEQQSEVVKKLLDLDGSLWYTRRSVHHGGHFPKEYVVSTGTSTGKTLISMVAACQMTLKGQRAAVVVEARLLKQWLAEYSKFKDIGLLPLIVVDCSSPSSRDWFQRYQANPKSLVLVSKGILIRSTQYSEQFNSIDWQVLICDECVNVPFWFLNRPNCFGVSLNASALGKIANQAQDEELGALPKLNVDSYHVRPICKTEPELLAKAYNGWIETLAFGKTVVVTSDRYWCPHPHGMTSVLDLIEVPSATHTARGQSTKKKRDVIAEFAAAQDGLLWAAGSYLSRGFNLPCKTLIVLDLRGEMSDRVLLQVIGRVRRVQTGIEEVRVHLISGRARKWTLLASLHKRSTSAILTNSKALRALDQWKTVPGVAYHPSDEFLEHVSLQV